LLKLFKFVHTFVNLLHLLFSFIYYNDYIFFSFISGFSSKSISFNTISSVIYIFTTLFIFFVKLLWNLTYQLFSYQLCFKLLILFIIEIILCFIFILQCFLVIIHSLMLYVFKASIIILLFIMKFVNIVIFIANNLLIIIDFTIIIKLILKYSTFIPQILILLFN
jgi:hypothetical protein